MSVEAKLEILLEAVDQASAIFKTASDNIQSSMGQVTTAQQNVDTATKASEVSTTDMLLATNNLASGCAGLVNSVLSVERAQYMVEKAHLAVNRATDNAEKSQEAYNEAVSKYGVDSDQAKQAADHLAIAQEALNVAQDRAGIVQNSLNQAMVSAALNVIPSLISTVNAATTIMSSFMTATEMASLAMDAIPFVAVAAGIALAGVAIYSWISASNAAAESQRQFDKMLSDHNELMNRTVTTWDELSQAMADNTENLKKLQAKYDEISAKEDVHVKLISDLAAMYDNFGLTADQLKQGLDNVASGYEKVKDGITDNMTVGEAQQIQWDEDLRIQDLYFSTVTQKTEAYQKSVSGLADTFTTDFANMTMAQVKDSDVMKVDIQALADQYHVSWEQMYNDIKTSMENSQKAAEEFTSGLENKFNISRAKAFETLPVIAAMYDEAFSERRFGECTDIVVEFSHRFGISMEESEAIIDGFQAKVADLPKIFATLAATSDQAGRIMAEFAKGVEEVPKTIQKSLIEEAQAKFEQFKNCISGKALTTSTDVVGTMADMAAQVTDLISKGFVGEAQAEMAAYVDCSTNKVADMVAKISGKGGYIDQLTTQHNDKIKTLTEAAANAYGSEKDVILAQIDAENAGFKTRMGNLGVWLSEFDAQLLMQADNTMSQVDAIVGGAKAALAQVQGNIASTQGILENVFTSLAASSDDAGRIMAQLARGVTPGTASPYSSGSAEQNQQAISLGYSSYEAYQAQIAMQGGVPAFAEGGIFTKPTLAIIGEKGPEAVVPIDIGRTLELPRSKGENSTQITITGPLVEINDSMIDRPMVDFIRKEVFKALENVWIEPTSVSAPANSKRIRKGTALS